MTDLLVGQPICLSPNVLQKLWAKGLILVEEATAAAAAGHVTFTQHQYSGNDVGRDCEVVVGSVVNLRGFT